MNRDGSVVSSSFLATPVTCSSSLPRDQTRATAVAISAAFACFLAAFAACGSSWIRQLAMPPGNSRMGVQSCCLLSCTSPSCALSLSPWKPALTEPRYRAPAWARPPLPGNACSAVIGKGQRVGSPEIFPLPAGRGPVGLPSLPSRCQAVRVSLQAPRDRTPQPASVSTSCPSPSPRLPRGLNTGLSTRGAPGAWRCARAASSPLQARSPWSTRAPVFLRRRC